MSYNKIVSLLGSDADSLPKHTCNTISKDSIRTLTPNYIEDSFVNSNKFPQISHGNSDLSNVVKTAVINKRAGGVGLIVDHISFPISFKKGIELLHVIQDIFLCKEIVLAYSK